MFHWRFEWKAAANKERFERSGGGGRENLITFLSVDFTKTCFNEALNEKQQLTKKKRLKGAGGERGYLVTFLSVDFTKNMFQ